MDVSPRNGRFRCATCLIPFLENDDAIRALMGSNMQRQAVPLLIPRSAYSWHGYGIQSRQKTPACAWFAEDGRRGDKSFARDSISVKDDETKATKDTYKLLKFKRSNQGTCVNQHPIVKLGERVKAGDIIADGPSAGQRRYGSRSETCS